MQIDKISSRKIRVLRISFSAHPVPYIIFHRKYIPCLFQYFRLMIPQPCEKTDRLTCKNVLTSLFIHFFRSSVFFPLFHICPCPRIGGNDSVISGFSVFSDQIQTFSMPGIGHARNLFRIDPALFDRLTRRLCIYLPEFLHIPLRIPRLRRHCHGRNACHRNLHSVLIKQCRFGKCSAIVDSHQISHFASSCPIFLFFLLLLLYTLSHFKANQQMDL